MADKIQVAVRVRPVLFQKKDVEVHWGSEKGMIYQIDPATKKRLGNPYLFDQVFEPHTQNHQIFSSVVQPLIDSAMDGFNVTVLAYGQTASGKTYTMMGSQKECGIVQLAVERIFNTIEQNPERAFLLRCSYIEIYNETISDLLSSTHQKLKLQELAEGNVIVHNLIETNVNSPDAVIKLMQQGNKQRKVGGTSMNERSSRSHTIFRIIVESVPRAEADRSDAAVMVSHINLVDLAGSEKASQTNATGDRFREGCAINTSLSALSLVIKQLSDGEGFVNFRDSKLTHILRASLGGNARTAIICNVTPTVLDETSSTLKFASSAKTVQNQPHVNEVLSDQALLRKYNNYIKDLEKKLKEKEQEQRPEEFEEMERLLQEKEMKIQELKEKLVISSVTQGSRGDETMSSSQRNLRRMTWGGPRLQQMLNFPPVPVFENPAPAFASVGVNRMRRTSFKSRKSEPSIEEVSGESDSMDTENFVPAEVVFAKPLAPVTKADAATMTDIPEASPFRKPFDSPFRRPQTPGTPVPILRERLSSLRKSLEEKEQENSDLREELEDLSNFTRLEQQIGVHAQSIAKSCSTQESAEQLHKALQTANDMEVLYLDTQRKFSELQTEYREKEVEHEKEVESLRTDFQQRLDEETSERKRLAKELTTLREKHDRLELDQAEADTHLQVVTERHAKREADLRKSLQEAWTQLESAGQDPSAFQEGIAAKEQVSKLSKEIEEMQAKYQEAQEKISALSEELRNVKESTSRRSLNPSVKEDQLDNSLSGMCLADELRDVFMEHDSPSFAIAPVRPRKRPSSILSVALAKMEQSTCILDGEHDVEPSKRTRFSVMSVQTEDLDIKEEAKEIREYLLELQAVLVRYEADFDILRSEKETINSQLVANQNEVSNLRELLALKNSGRRSLCPVAEDAPSGKLDVSTEDFETSCVMEDQSIVAVQSDMEQSTDEVVDIPEKTTDTLHQESAAAAGSIQQELLNNELDQLKSQNESLERSIKELTEKLHSLQEEIDAKTCALAESERSLQDALSASQALESASEEKDVLKSELIKASDEIRALREESASLVGELEDTRASLAETRSKLAELSEEQQACANRLLGANEELESVRSELKAAQEQILLSQENNQASSNNLALEMDLAESQDRINELQAALEFKTSEVQAVTTALDQAVSHVEELEVKLAANASNSEELTTALSKIESLEAELDAKTSEMDAVKRALEEASTRMTLLENQSSQEDDSQQFYLERIQALEDELRTKGGELESIQSDLENSRSLVAKHEQEKKDRIAELEAQLAKAIDEIKSLRAELEVKSIEVDAAKTALEEANAQDNTDCSEREKLEEMIEHLTCQLEDLKQMSEDKDQQLSDMRDAAYQSSVEHKEMMESERATNKKEIGQLVEQINELSTQFEATAAELAMVKQELADNSASAREILLSKENMEIQLQSTHAKLRELEEELNEKNKQLENVCSSNSHEQVDSVQVAKLEVELEDARKKIEELQVANDFLQADVTSAEVRSVELETQIEAKNAALSKAESANAKFQDIREQLDAKVDQICELKSKLEEANIQIAELCSQKEEANAELKKAHERIESLEEDVESERDALLATQRAAQEASEKAEAKLLEMEADKSSLNKQLNGALGEIEKLKQSIDSITLELQEAKSQVVTLEEANRLNSVPREDMTALEQQWNDAVLRVAQLESQLEYETSKHNEACRNLEESRSRIQCLETELKDYSTRIETLQCTVEDLSNKNLAQDARLEHLQSTLLAKDEEMSNYRTVSSKISALESQLEASNGEIAQLSRIVEEKSDQVRALEEELSRVSQGEQSRVEHLQCLEKKLRDSRAELEETRSALFAMQTESERITSDLADKENHNVELRRSLESTNQRFDMIQAKLESVQAEKSRLNQHVQRLEAEIDCRERELQGLRSGMEGLHQERDVNVQLKQRLSSVQAEKEAAVQHCEKLREARDEILRQQDRLTQELHELSSRLQTSESAKSSLEQTLVHYESQKDVFLQDYQRLKAALADAEDRLKREVRELAVQLQASNAAKEALEHSVAQYESQKETFVHEYQRMKVTLASTEERLGREVRELAAQLQASNETKVNLEQIIAQFEGQREAFLQDYQRLKKSLADTEEQLQAVQLQRDDYLVQMKSLNEQLSDTRARITAFESTSKYQTQRHLEETIEALKRELVETRSNKEIQRLNHDTEEENRRKKIERLEKELDTLKQQYIKCKEQLRLSRYRENEEGTVSLPKMRSLVATSSAFVQTDPIADKGFGFRWQADQYSADNERLRKKVSEIGERMEFYKEKLIKYRNLYYQTTGQDANQRPPSGGSNPVHPVERRSSTSSNSRENMAGAHPAVETEKVGKGKPVTPTSGLSSGALQEQQHARDSARVAQTRSSIESVGGGVAASSRLSGSKKHTLTKEEMEKINNCNPS